ncbi:MAG: AlpA family phage regulatory protein [Morganella sp. (in: enterobacteria)]
MDNKLITAEEVMSRLSISSRQTLLTYEKKRKFPKPVKLRPKAYLRHEYNQWLNDGGVNQKSS